VSWGALLDHPAVAAAEFRFEQVPFDHPLWILFSSGTTGLPKAIVHGHGGILLEQMKLQRFHMDLRQGDRAFFYTTTGWMMWNFLVSSLLIGVCPVLYDGSPAYPQPDVLWQTAQECGVSFFGASPAYVDLMSKAGVVPAEKFDLPGLRAIMLAGSPVSAAAGRFLPYQRPGRVFRPRPLGRHTQPARRAHRHRRDLQRAHGRARGAGRAHRHSPLTQGSSAR
jgi:acetoacetyl-CoA synthetase